MLACGKDRRAYPYAAGSVKRRRRKKPEYRDVQACDSVVRAFDKGKAKAGGKAQGCAEAAFFVQGVFAYF